MEKHDETSASNGSNSPSRIARRNELGSSSNDEVCPILPERSEETQDRCLVKELFVILVKFWRERKNQWNPFKLLTFKRKRRYPIKYDEYGKSARERAWELFHARKRPSEVAKLIGISLRTACRYFSDWKRCPRNKEERRLVAKIARKDVELFEKVVKTVVTELELPEDQVRAQLRQPRGLDQLASGKLKRRIAKHRQTHRWDHLLRRLEAACRLIALHEWLGITLEQIDQKFSELRAEARARAQAEEGKPKP